MDIRVPNHFSPIFKTVRNDELSNGSISHDQSLLKSQVSTTNDDTYHKTILTFI